MANGPAKSTDGNSDETRSDGNETDSIERDMEQSGQINTGNDESGIDNASDGNTENTPFAKEFVASEPLKKKRGRPPKNKAGIGSGTSAPKQTETKTPSKLDRPPLDTNTINQFSGFYQFINNAIATSNNAPDFQINGQEAVAIGTPLSEILNDMGLLGADLGSPYIRLAMAVAGVYGGRVMSRMVMAKEKAKAKRQAETVQAATVEDMMATDMPTMNFNHDVAA